jgi:hypothetical protein
MTTAKGHAIGVCEKNVPGIAFCSVLSGMVIDGTSVFYLNSV